MTAAPKTLRFHFVDVFAVAPFTGNPVVVVEDADDLPVRLLQQIAREFNQSETTFLLTPTCAGADWRLLLVVYPRWCRGVRHWRPQYSRCLVVACRQWKALSQSEADGVSPGGWRPRASGHHRAGGRTPVAR